MHKEVEKTVLKLCELINDKLEKGCSSEELKALPELVKSLSDLMNSVGRKSNLEKRVAELKEMAAVPTTTDVLQKLQNTILRDSLNLAIDGQLNVIPFLQSLYHLLNILFGEVDEIRRQCGLPKEENSIEIRVEQVLQALHSQIRENIELMDCYNQRQLRSGQSSDQKKSI